MAEKYTIGEVKASKINQFEVIIEADSNDGDYITTRHFYSEERSDENVIEELIELLSKHGDAYELESFSENYVDIPYSDYGCCHSLESVEVNYYDNNGSVRPVEINSGYYTDCQTCSEDKEDCVCKDDE